MEALLIGFIGKIFDLFFKQYPIQTTLVVIVLWVVWYVGKTFKYVADAFIKINESNSIREQGLFSQMEELNKSNESRNHLLEDTVNKIEVIFSGLKEVISANTTVLSNCQAVDILMKSWNKRTGTS